MRIPERIVSFFVSIFAFSSASVLGVFRGAVCFVICHPWQPTADLVCACLRVRGGKLGY